MADPQGAWSCANCTARGGRAASAISHNNAMPSAYSSPPIACTGGPLSAIDADLLIVPWFEDDAAGHGRRRRRDRRRSRARARGQGISGANRSSCFWRRSPTAPGARRASPLIGGGSGERGSALIRKLATAAGLAARQRRVGARRVRGARHRRRARARAGGRRRADARRVPRRELQDGRSAARPRRRRGRSRDRRGDRLLSDAIRRRGARPDSRRVQQHGARARQRAGQHAHAAGIREARGGAGERRRRQGRDPRRDARSRSWGWGCCSASRAAAPSRRA